MEQTGFKDYFSGHAESYARFRPAYPEALFVYLTGLCATRSCAWDCATGNGQAAAALASRFEHVIATDASADQIARVDHDNGIEYRVAPAEASGIAPGGVDLITVAQALHWFDLDGFYAEVQRVLKPNGILAAWCYGLFSCDPTIDGLIQRLYSGTLAEWWPPERAHVDAGYRSLPFPFAEITAPAFCMEANWTLTQVVGYLRTWSAVERHRKQRREDPVAAMLPELESAWGEARRRRIRWPLHLRVGRTADR